MSTWKNVQGSQRYKYRSRTMLTAAVFINGALSKLDCRVNRQRAIQLLLTFSSVPEKTGRCHCGEVAVVERFKQEAMYGLSAGTEGEKVAVACKEVAVSRGSTVNLTQ